MGKINDVFIDRKISLKSTQEILKMFITNNIYKSQNYKILQEIGLIKEYSYINSTLLSTEDIIYILKDNKIIRNYIDKSKLKSNFIEWTKLLFDIDDQNITLFHIKMENLKSKALNKNFFENNFKKNMKIDNNFERLISFGIPNNLRDFIWECILNERYNKNREYI